MFVMWRLPAREEVNNIVIPFRLHNLVKKEISHLILDWNHHNNEQYHE